jgi:hypothetical protein
MFNGKSAVKPSECENVKIRMAKITLEQAMKAQSRSRSISLLFL